MKSGCGTAYPVGRSYKAHCRHGLRAAGWQPTSAPLLRCHKQAARGSLPRHPYYAATKGRAQVCPGLGVVDNDSWLGAQLGAVQCGDRKFGENRIFPVCLLCLRKLPVCAVLPSKFEPDPSQK